MKNIIIFNIISALSTTGYGTMDFSGWPFFAIGILILMMLAGGGMGSTAGGIKLSRIYLMLRFAVLNIHKKLTSSRNIESPYYIKAQGKTSIDNELIYDTMGFIICYMIIFISGSLLITLSEGSTLTESMFEFSSAFSTVGLSIGITGPSSNKMTLIVEIIGMILGRLEIFIVIIGISTSFKIAVKFIKSLFYHRKSNT